MSRAVGTARGRPDRTRRRRRRRRTATCLASVTDGVARPCFRRRSRARWSVDRRSRRTHSRVLGLEKRRDRTVVGTSSCVTVAARMRGMAWPNAAPLSGTNVRCRVASRRTALAEVQSSAYAGPPPSSRPTAAQSSAIPSSRPGSETAPKPWSITRATPASRYARSRSRRGAPAGASGRPHMWTDTRRVAGSRPISSQREAMTGSALSHLVGHQRVEVELVGEAGGQPPRHLRAVAADEDRDPAAGRGLGSWIASSTWAWRPAIRRVARSQHPADDLEVVGQDRQPLRRVREAVPVGAPLVFLPARPDAELGPTAAR